MLPKTHLTSHSRMSGSGWVTTPSWLSRSSRLFLCSSSMYSFQLFLISFASVKSLPFLSVYHAHPCMKCFFDISDFLEEISILFCSIVFSIHWHCLLKNTFFSLLAILWNSAFSWVYLSLSSLPFATLSSATCKTSSKQSLCLLAKQSLSFSLGWFWSCTLLLSSVHSSSGTLPTKSNPLSLFHHIIIRDLI